MNGADRDSVMVDTNSWDVDQKKKKTTHKKPTYISELN